MTPRDLDPAMWAAAYAAEYREQREAARLAGADTLTRHAPTIGADVERCRELADAAVLALHPEGAPCCRPGLSRDAPAKHHAANCPIGDRLARSPVPEARKLCKCPGWSSTLPPHLPGILGCTLAPVPPVTSEQEPAVDLGTPAARARHEQQLEAALRGTGATVLVGHGGVTIALPSLAAQQASQIAAVLRAGNLDTPAGRLAALEATERACLLAAGWSWDGKAYYNDPTDGRPHDQAHAVALQRHRDR